jgi:hypothetical protein
MKDIMEIKQWSREEKLQVMEAIWEDLSQEDQFVQSPAWHESLLRETEQRVQSGEEQIHKEEENGCQRYCQTSN